MVKSCLVPETAKTGEVVLLESYTGKVESHHLAEVELEVAHRRVTLKVALEEHGKYDVLLGTDFPGLWELGWQLVNAQALQLVQTRSQTVRNEGDRHQENMETDRESPIEEATLEWSETETETDSEQEADQANLLRRNPLLKLSLPILRERSTLGLLRGRSERPGERKASRRCFRNKRKKHSKRNRTKTKPWMLLVNKPKQRTALS